MASEFPKLPGFIPTQDIDRTNFKRVSAKKQDNNKEIVNTTVPLDALPRQTGMRAPDQTSAIHPKYTTTNQSTFKPINGEVTELYQPSWVALDRQVLRFNGFFKESVVESPMENHRIRRVVIHFYLEDSSISVNEPRQTNSGIPQGVFLKRQKVVKPDGSGRFFSFEDLRVGEDVTLFGKLIRITDCDQYTTEFYDNLGQPQGEGVTTPNDNFETKTMTKYVPQKDDSMKNYLEHKLGGGRPAPQKQFLENDRKVLKFYVFSEIPYLMHYYLADDTVEIREINFPNSGRDAFPVFLRRQKLPRKFALNQPGQTHSEDFLKPEEVYFGSTINVFNRPFIVNGCDPFTQQYFKENFNREFPLGNVEQPKPKEVSNFQVPPFNGFGDEEDSMGNVYRLVPQPPKKDYFKWVDNQIYLRFVARLNTKVPEDVDRRFIITFYLNDDTLLVYEPQQRNSGIVEGKFLEKKKYKNPERNNDFFIPADLMVGKDVKVNGYSFHVLDCDDFTKKWYIDNFHFH